MKLRRGEVRDVYLDDDGNEVERAALLEQVQGRSLNEAKKVVAQHRKVRLQEWTDREGNTLARSYGHEVVGIEIKPADADARRADLLKRLKDAQARVVRPDATPEDLAEAMKLQIEYLELMDMLAD